MFGGYTGCMKDALGVWGNKGGLWGWGVHGLHGEHTGCLEDTLSVCEN